MSHDEAVLQAAANNAAYIVKLEARIAELEMHEQNNKRAIGVALSLIEHSYHDLDVARTTLEEQLQ